MGRGWTITQAQRARRRQKTKTNAQKNPILVEYLAAKVLRELEEGK